MALTNYSRGYANASRRNDSQPAQIKCRDCGIIKNSDQFSTKQLEILQKRIPFERFTSGKTGKSGFDATKVQYISCTNCTSQQVQELECFMCDRWMGLDKFTKVQRRTPDHAECIQCVQERLEMEAFQEYRDEHEDDDQDGNDGAGQGGSGSSDEDDNNISGATASMGGMSVTENTYPTQKGSSNLGGGVSLSNSTPATSRQTASTQAASIGGTSVAARAGFNRSGYSSGSKASSGAWAKPPKGENKPTPAKKAAAKTAAKTESEDEDTVPAHFQDDSD